MNIGILLGAATAVGLAGRAGSDDVVKELREQRGLLREVIESNRPRQRQYSADRYLEMLRQQDPTSVISVWFPEDGPVPAGFQGIIRDKRIPLSIQKEEYLHPERFSDV